MNILKLLSEEIFSDVTNMSSQKKNELKMTMNEEFSKIYELCDWVLKTAIMHPGAVQNSLIKACLSTLAAFLEWVPPVHIYSGDFLKFLIENYLESQVFRTQTLECLTEVAGVTMEIPTTDPYFQAYHSSVLNLLVSSISKLSIHFPYTSTNFTAIHNASDSNTQLMLKNFCQHLALFFLSYIQHHLPLIEQTVQTNTNPETENIIISALRGLFTYMISLTSYPEDEIFKICCDFWHNLSKHLFEARGAS